MRGTALWVLPVGDIGGVARHVVDAVSVGVPDWRIIVLTPPGALADHLVEQGVPTLTETFGPAAGVQASRAALKHAIAKLRPDIVHTHLAYADLTAATVPRGRAALVSTEHGIAADDLVYHGSRLRATAAAMTHRARLERFDALIAVSQATAHAMKEKWRPRRPITVIPNGVDRMDLRAIDGARSPGLRVTALSRLAPEKGLPQLLHSFAILAADHPEARLTVAGDGPLRDDLVRRARVLGIDHLVTFPGFVDSADQLTRTDVLAQLSVWENCSYTLLDAMRAGTGVAATPVGGNPEMLPDHCLIDWEDSEGVAALLADQALHLERRPALPKNWPSRATMTAQIAEVYDQAVTRRRKHG